jgi:acetyl-CoA synthetase
MFTFFPHDNFKREANLQDKEYSRLLEKFSLNPDIFWSDLARNIYWYKDFEQVFDYLDKPFFEWFQGGKTNISYNCVDRHLETKGDKAALIFENELGNCSCLSYKDLFAKVNLCANLLKKIGVRKGDFVTIYMPMCPEAIIAMHACLRIGAVHSVVFGGFSAKALKERLLDLDSHYIITADILYRRGKVISLLDTVYQACEDLSSIKTILCYKRDEKTLLNNKTLDWMNEINSVEAYCEPEWLDSEDPSFILYTSGSTGKPKGILHTTAGYLIWAHITSYWVFDLKDNDIYWCTADIGWITGHSYVAYGPLSNAATVFIYEGAPDYPNPSKFWEMIDKYKVSIFYTAPTAIRAFMQWGDEYVTKCDLGSLRLLATVGEPINPVAWEWFYRVVGKELCPIVDTWWQTETGGIMVTTLPGIHRMKPGLAGLPLPGVELSITDENILYLNKALPSMARDIYGDKERYINSYWKDGIYLAGDSASRDEDFYVKIGGRIDDVINISGHRLGTAEIESALVAHDLVAEAAVVAIPHDIKGQGIVAYVILHSSDELDELENKLSLQIVSEIGSIAKPEKIFVVPALPKTRSGKIMRRLLKDIALGLEPSGDLSTLEDKSVLEKLLAASRTRGPL